MKKTYSHKIRILKALHDYLQTCDIAEFDTMSLEVRDIVEEREADIIFGDDKEDTIPTQG